LLQAADECGRFQTISMKVMSQYLLLKPVYLFLVDGKLKRFIQTLQETLGNFEKNDRNEPNDCILPERTCINNSAVTQLKKESFEFDAMFHPIAIKLNLDIVVCGKSFQCFSTMSYIFLKLK
jgi:hypothetical protein